MASPIRTAIVTGAAKRVGAAVARALVEAGWAVVGHVRSASDAVPEGAAKAVADLAQPDCATRIFAAIEGLPPVRLLVNCAARFEADALGAGDATEFDAHMAVNARAPMLLIDALAAQHQEGHALVVNITDAKLAAPNPDYLSYSLSKYALAGLTEVAARGLAAKGIRVNAIAPALMLPSGPQDEAGFAAAHALNPLGRGVEVAELVRALMFLVESPTITGQTLLLDGGQRFWALPRDVQFVERR